MRLAQFEQSVRLEWILLAVELRGIKAELYFNIAAELRGIEP